jgi:Cu-processing system ATP-binding protein
MIVIRNLKKSFGKLAVLRGLDLEIAEGEVTAILGPNAAGKSTLLKSILGLVTPDAGEIEVCGELLDGSPEYRRIIGYMPQNARFPENLTGRQVLEMIADVRNTGQTPDLSLVEPLRLESELDKPLKTLSGGTRQKVSAVITFMFDPKIIILDEPTAGLDPVSSSVLKDRILDEKRRGKTIVLTSHIMAEVEELAGRVVYLLDGAIRFDHDVALLKRQTGETRLERALAQLMTGGGDGASSAPELVVGVGREPLSVIKNLCRS